MGSRLEQSVEASDICPAAAECVCAELHQLLGKSFTDNSVYLVFY